METPTDTIAAVPLELRECPQWVVWRYEKRDDKPTKILYDPRTIRRAKANDRATWATFDEALEAFTESGLVDGLGFVFSTDDPYVGVDLDDCRNLERGELHPAAADIVARLDSYTEVSPSGTGVHVIVRGALTGSRNRTGKTAWGGEFEVYDRARFFCMTGDVFVDRPVIERPDELASLEAAMFPATEPLSVPVETLDDDQVLARAGAAKNADKFTRLWAGDTSGYGSASEADLALLSVLAFWTRDTDLLDRLFRRSGLMRDKWERGDYRHKTLARAVETVTAAPTTPTSATNGDRPKLRFRSLAEVVADIPEEPEWVVPGFIAPSTETLLVGPPKVGKSTLLFRLLAGLEGNGRALGLEVRKVSYLLLTEESPFTLQEKMFDFDLRGRGGEALLYQEARTATWVEVVQESVSRCKEKGHELLIVDTFSRWAGMGGEAENSAGSVQEAWKPFAIAKEAGLATTVLHHTRKSGGRHGEGIRGSNAIAALPDILLELARTGGEDDTARVLNANSRYRSTPDALGLSFTGDDYQVTSDVSTLRLTRRQQDVLEALADGPLTRQEIADRLDVGISAAIRHIERLVEVGRIYHTGDGQHESPYRYHRVEES